MRLTFENILYDNSAKKSKDNIEIESKNHYPGISSLYEMILKQYPNSVLNESVLDINNRHYIIRFRSENDSSGGWSWGGISFDGNFDVFAIKEDKKSKTYSMLICDSEFVRKKGKSPGGSWGTTEDEREYFKSKSQLVTELDVENLNRKIMEFVGGGK